MSKFLYKTSCPKCGSKDNVAVYLEDNGYLHGFCFTPGCGFQFWEKDEKVAKQKYKPISTSAGNIEGLIPFEFSDLKKRGIRESVCRAYLYGVGTFKGKPVHVANYLDENGTIVAQKLRTKDKKFSWVGNTNASYLLFGQHLSKGNGQLLVITEGEIDALSVAQAFNLQIPVVSIPNGAGGAVKAINNHLDFVESFDKVILAFDNDQAGQKAIQAVAEIITPGKVYKVNFGEYKDANEVLIKANASTLRHIIQKATPYTPEGVVLGNTLTIDYLKGEPDTVSYSLPFPLLDRMLRGLRKKEMTLLTAGTGVGKSTMAREIAFHLITKYPQLKIGYVALEESVRQSALGFIALYHNIPLGDLYMNPNLLTEEQYMATRPLLEKIIFYNHFGSLQSNKLTQSIKYMIQGLKCDFIFLDHISIVVSGLEVKDERKQIDILMTKLRSIIEQTKAGMVIISHLRKYNTSKTAEEGRRIVLDDLRGSGALKQLADNVIAIEAVDKDIRQIRLLKNRLFGDIGEADIVSYNRETGRLEVYGEAFSTEF